jgi:hypothetical protein
MMQMRPSFPSANSVFREQFASHEKEANSRRHAAVGSATNSCATNSLFKPIQSILDET